MSPGGASLRILFLAPQPFFEVRGTPLAVLAMVKALVALGHEVDLLTFPQGEAVEVPGLTHRRSLRLPVGHVRAGASLAKLALDVPFVAEAVGRMAFGRYDVVHAVEEAAHLVAPCARLLGLPLVADVDSSIPDQLRYSGFAGRGPLPWIADRLETHALRHAAVAITVCGSLTAGVKAKAPAVPVFQVEDPPLGNDVVPRPRGGCGPAQRRSASGRSRSSSTPATSSPTRAWSSWWRPRAPFPKRASSSWEASRIRSRR